MSGEKRPKHFTVLIFEILDLDDGELSGIKDALVEYLKKLSPARSIKTIVREGNKATIELNLPISSRMIALVERLIENTVNTLRAEEYFSTEEKEVLWKKLNIRLVDLPVSPTTLLYFKSQPTYLGRFVGQLVRKKFIEIIKKQPRIISKVSLSEVVQILENIGLRLGMEKFEIAGWKPPTSQTE